MLRALRPYLITLILSLLFGLNLARGQSVVPTATLTVNGVEAQPNGSWDSGNIRVDFNGFVEIVNYAQYSTQASLASALAAMFVRDYHSFGLYAKAAVNSAQQNVVTFQLVDGSAFGPLNVVDPSVSFTLAGSGFASSSATTADIGVATLTVNGTTVSTANYGNGSTGASVAQDLAQNASSNLVAVTSESTSQGGNLYLQVKQATGSYSYPYSITYSTNISFSNTSGILSSGTDAAPITVYSYCIGQTNPCNAPKPKIAFPGGSPTYGYLANGEVQNLNDSVMGNWTFGYDNLNRLISGTAYQGPYNGDSTCWSYDSFGNRTNQIVSNAPFTTANGTLCQPASGATNLASPATYQSADNHMTTTPQLPNGLPSGTGTWPNNGIYDAAGNVINDGVNQYTYDAEGRVCALNGPQGMIGYQYDADGNRVGKGTVTTIATCDITANGYQPTTDFVLDQSGGQMTEMAVSNTSAGTTYTWTHSNVTAGGALIASFDTTGYGLHFYLTDALGSRRVQTDPAGIPEQTCQSLPFGDQLYCTGSPAFPTEHHFTGKERDAESGLDYFGARYYASSMGRFSSPDPSGLFFADPTLPQSLNLYSYARNNPLIGTDPTGMAYCQWDDGTHDDSANTGVEGAVNSGTECTNAGGTWSHDDGLNDDGSQMGTEGKASLTVTATLNTSTDETSVSTTGESYDPDNANLYLLAVGITEDTNHAFGCIAGAYGVGAPSAATGTAGSQVFNASQNLVGKTKAAGALGGSTAYTSEAAMAARSSALANIPSFGLKSPVGTPFAGNFAMRTSPNMGVAAGRYAPYIGAAGKAAGVAGTAYSSYKLWNCLGTHP
jgi:RHS repeat-associated protein